MAIALRTGGNRTVPPTVALAAGVFAVFALLRRELTSDAFLDAYAGRYVAHHGIPHSDAFTAVGAGHAWVDQQWLGQLILYAADSTAGYAGGVALCALVVALTGALTYRLLRARLSALRSFEITVLVLTALASNTAVRAQTLCYPLWCVVLWIVVAQPERLTRRRAFLLVVTLVVWANLHGSVVLAAGAVAACSAFHAWRALGAERRRLATLAVAAVLAPLATPYGFSIIGYYRSVLVNGTMQTYSSEWRAPGLNIASVGFLVTFAAAVVAAFVFRRQWREMLTPAGALTIVIAALAVHSIRFGAWFGLPAALTFATVAGTAQATRVDRAPRWIAATTCIAAVLVTTLLALSGPTVYQASAPPVLLAQADRALDSHPGSVLLGDSTVAPAILWRYPDTTGRVLYDARWETYTPAQLNRYGAALEGHLDLTAYSRRCIVIVASADAAFVHNLRHRRDLDLIDDSASGAVALTPACRHGRQL